jgi:hypothetical protein
VLKRRSGEAKNAVKQITADLANTAAAEAAAVVRNTRRAPGPRRRRRVGQAASRVAELEQTLTRTAKVVAQTRTRLAGDDDRLRRRGRRPARPR